jgi:zinc transporter ZupT
VSDAPVSVSSDADRGRNIHWLPGLLLALLVVGGAFALMARIGTGSLLRPPSAPLQNLSFERVTLRPGHIEVVVRNAGPHRIDVAQVLVDDAYWSFTISPGRHLGRLDAATVRLSYPWVAGEPLAITIVDGTGLTFVHEIVAATVTPEASGRTYAGYVLLGTYAGVIPVMLGLLFLPALRRIGDRGLRFLLGLTAGLLVFLAVDALSESLELAGDVAEPFQGTAVVAGGVGLSLAALVMVSRKLHGGRTGPSPLAVAYLIAIGIGMHNLGEGLAIGSAQAVGAIALGTFLVIGFAIHNLTEGVGIVAPTIRTPPGIGQLLALGAVAGLPTIAGTIIGGFAYSKVLATFLLAIGVGAILQVVYELARLVRRESSVLAGPWVGGIAAGFVVMYATGLAIKS